MNESRSSGALSNLYEQRIGTPRTSDEVNGYWLFVAGVLTGVIGMVLFFLTEAATVPRGMAYAFAALALPFMILGAVIRFPLRRAGTSLGYLGAFLSFTAVVWFVSIFPDQWSTISGQSGIITLYSLGIGITALAGTAVPLLTDPIYEAHATQQAENEQMREEATDRDADLAESRERAVQLEDQVKTLQAEIDTARQSAGRFEVFQDKRSEYRWRLRHRNGNVIASSGEGYTRLHNAQKGMQSVRRNALGAGVLRIEPEPDADETPEPADAAEPVVALPTEAETIESRAAFELYEDNGGEYRWRLRHDNGNIIADSSEGYASKSGARKALDGIREYVIPADYLWFDPTGFEVYSDAASEWRWRLVHRNGNILADSGEGYTRRHDASRAVTRLRDRIDDLEFEIDEDAGNEWRWRLRSANGEIVADSGEGYDSRGNAEDAVERVQNYAPDADTLDIGQAAFELYEDAGNEWRWRLRHRNGNILSDSSEGYASKSGARDGIESVKRNAPTAEATELETKAQQ
ncbi:HVO_2922 family protein [Natronorubrum sp. DTA7]|uniref:HVO_2922 family protein n=1 Tax=Natronorubrum sp. DTA7 TaxID=3447016 RepID=UPI003F844E3B